MCPALTSLQQPVCPEAKRTCTPWLGERPESSNFSIQSLYRALLDSENLKVPKKSFRLRSLESSPESTLFLKAVRQAGVWDVLPRSLILSFSLNIWPEQRGCRATRTYNISHGSLQRNTVTSSQTDTFVIDLIFVVIQLTLITKVFFKV